MYALSYTNIIRLSQSSSMSRQDLITCLIDLLQKYDKYTAGHTSRVGQIAAQIAQNLGLSSSEIQLVYEAGSLHDIGKIHIPLECICKAGALSEDEYNDVKKHPLIGAEILHYFPTLLDLIPGVLYHHERYDGGGYPFGLKRDQIPLSARIIAVADTFDAMTSTRSYRTALDMERAKSELAQCADGQLDPKLVNIALQILE